MADVEKSVKIKVDDSDIKKSTKAVDAYEAAVEHLGWAHVKAAKANNDALKSEIKLRGSAGVAAVKSNNETLKAQLSSRLVMKRALSGEGVAGAVASGTVVGRSLYGFAEGLVERIKGMQELGAATAEAGAKFGASTPAINKWRYVLGLSAEDAGKVSERMKRMGKDDGDLRAVADRMKLATTSAQRLAIASTALGADMAEKLLPTLMKGGENLDRLQSEFKKLGGGFTSKAIAQFTSMGQAIKRLQFAGEGLSGELATGIGPIFTWISDKIAYGTAAMTQFSRGTGQVRVAMVALGVAVAGAGLAMAAGLAPVFIATLVTFGPWVLGLGAAFLILEDIGAWAKGDGSVLGDILKRTFGEKSNNEIRAWFNGMTKWVNDVKPLIDGLAASVNAVGAAWRFAKGVTDLGIQEVEQLMADSDQMRNGGKEDELGNAVRAQRWNTTVANMFAPAASKVDQVGAAGAKITGGSGGGSAASPQASTKVIVQEQPIKIYNTSSAEETVKLIKKHQSEAVRVVAANTPGMVPQGR